MFIDTAVETPDYVDFGAEPVEQRIAALAARTRRIAYYYDTPNTSSFRYRALNMVQAINAWIEGDVSASWFCQADIGHVESFVDRADALVICRALYRPALDRMTLRARARGIPVIFDCDDLVFDPRYAPVIMHTLDLDLGSDRVLDTWYALLSRHQAAMRLCDRGIATNEFLAARMTECEPHLETRVVPNFLHRVQQAFSTDLYLCKHASGFRSDGALTIGYFSGSPSHNRDFGVASAALADVLDSNPRVMLRIVGFLEQKGRLAAYADRIEHLPLQNPIALQRLMAEAEISIVPLQQNVFTNCKSELKFFEAAIVGSLTVATPTYAYARTIVDGENGFLAQSQDWARKLREACDLIADHERYIEMARHAFAYAERYYGWRNHGAMIANVVFGAPTEERTDTAMSRTLVAG